MHNVNIFVINCVWEWNVGKKLIIHWSHIGKFIIKKTFNSIRIANIRNIIYRNKHIIPTFLFNLNLKHAITV